MLEGFEILTPVKGAPAMSITEAGLSFNKNAVEKLGKSPFVKIMLNRATRQIALVVCKEDDEGSRSFFKSGRDARNGVRWNNYDLKYEISSLMNWDLSVDGKKIKGVYNSDVNALIFDLLNASSLPTRNRGGVDE